MNSGLKSRHLLVAQDSTEIFGHSDTDTFHLASSETSSGAYIK